MNINQVSASRESLPTLYREICEANPLLSRIENQCLLIGWTEEEIRTMQLLTAVRSNESLQRRLQELEEALAKPV